MRKIVFFLLLLPLNIFAQDNNNPSVQFDQGIILYNIPSQSAFSLTLPACKPGFVHIRRTPGFQVKPNQEISNQLTSDIRQLLTLSMSAAQKCGFLEKYACLILINYLQVSTIDTVFYTTATLLQEDQNQDVRDKSDLVVKMVDMYRKEEQNRVHE